MTEIDYAKLPHPEAEVIANRLESALGIAVRPFSKDTPFDASRKMLLINGDEYQHHFTKTVVERLINARQEAHLPPFSYVHIDGHDDTAEMYAGDDSSFKSFVVGIMKANHGGVYLLEEGLTGERHNEVTFLTPMIDDKKDDWGPSTTDIRDRDVYISIDLDVLDIDAGVNHLFPQTKIGFTVDRLLAVLQELGTRYNIIGADVVGFSLQGTTPQGVEQSLDNITQIVRKLRDIMGNPGVRMLASR